MSISLPVKMCERSMVNAMARSVRIWKRGLQLFAVTALAISAVAEGTNAPTVAKAEPKTNAAAAVAEPAPRLAEAPSVSAPSSSRGFDESAFRIVAERNIFNANRSGGQVRLSSSRRPSRVESFTLVGTMAYEKGAFAFFEGSSSEYSKSIKSGGVIAGHKIVDVLANGVQLEADGKILELAIGSGMRREDEGAWRLGEGVASSSEGSRTATRESGNTSRSSRTDSGSRSSRTSRRDSGSNNGSNNGRSGEAATKAEPTTNGTTTSPASNVDQAEILKRLMERREKE